MNIIIAGCRDFYNYDFFKSNVEAIFSGIQEEITIIEGGAKGADYLAKQYAIENKIKYKEYPADWEKYGKKAGILRNLEMSKVGNMLIAFWDNVSTGTKNMIKVAKDNGLITHVIDINPSKGKIYLSNITRMKKIDNSVKKLLIARKPIDNYQKYGLSHVVNMAPSEALFNDFKGNKINWYLYVMRFRYELLSKQKIVDTILKNLENGVSIALICYCTKSDLCHRKIWGNLFSELGYEIIDI